MPIHTIAYNLYIHAQKYTSRSCVPLTRSGAAPGKLRSFRPAARRGGLSPRVSRVDGAGAPWNSD